MSEDLSGTSRGFDPLLGLRASVRFVHPFQAVKSYTCPQCSREIPARTGHYVVVPDDAPDLRRHWHKHCWVRTRPR